MAESQNPSAEGPADRPLLGPRDSPDVERAFARLRDLVAASERPHHEVAAEVDLTRPTLSKLLHPDRYQATRDWAQVHAILIAVDADVEEYTRAHGHLWDLGSPTPTQASTPAESAGDRATGEPVLDARADGLGPGRRRADEWPGDEPTMPVSDPPTPRDASPTTLHEAPVPGPRVPPPLQPSATPLAAPVTTPPMSPRVPPPLVFVPRAPRRRTWLRRLRKARWGMAMVLVVVLVAGVVVTIARSGGRPSEPGTDAVSAQQAPTQTPTAAPTDGPALPQLDDPSLTAPTAPAAPPLLLNRPEVAATVAVGPIAGFAAPSPDGRTVYVAHRTRGIISEIDTATNQVRTTYPVPAGPPQSLAVSPDGARLYVSVYDGSGAAAVAVLDARLRQQIVAIPFATRPFVSALTPDGKTLWVPDHDTGTISVVDLTTNTIARQFEVSPNPHWITFSPDGTRAYAANHESNVVDVIDTATFARLASIPVGTSPHSIALQPHGSLLAVAAYDTDGVDLVDTTTGTRAATVPVGRNPDVVHWSPDGRLLYACVEGEGRVVVIDPVARRVVGDVPVGRTPSSLALTPDGTRAYATNLDDGTVSVLRTQ